MCERELVENLRYLIDLLIMPANAKGCEAFPRSCYPYFR